MSSAETLHRLADNFVRGRPLPKRIGTKPISTWLDGLSGDQRECHFTDIAIQLGITTERPWIGEVAATLRYRIEE